MKQFLSLMNGMMEYRQLSDALTNGRTPVSVVGTAASHKTHLIAPLARVLDRGAPVVVPDWSTAYSWAADLSILWGEKALPFRDRGLVLRDGGVASGEVEHRRLG